MSAWWHGLTPATLRTRSSPNSTETRAQATTGSIAQHNLGVVAAGSSKRHLIKYAFQVCNGADEERGLVVAARPAPLEEIEAFLPGLPGGRAILDKPGKVERLGIVASADPSDAELEQARAELTVKIAATELPPIHLERRRSLRAMR